MIKSWLIKTGAPYAGTDQYYRAYSEIDPLEIDKVNTWFWEEETMDLWDMYGFRWEDEFEDEYEEVKDDFESFEDFVDAKIQEWRESCSISSEECDEEDFHMYVPGGEGELEIIYDERTLYWPIKEFREMLINWNSILKSPTGNKLILDYLDSKAKKILTSYLYKYKQDSNTFLYMGNIIVI